MACIEEFGPAVGMSQIAERAGVPRPHLYRLVASKDELDDQVTRMAADELVARVGPAMSLPGTPLDIARGSIGAAVAWAAEHPNLYRFVAARQQTKALHRTRLGRRRFFNTVVEAVTAYLRSSNIEQDVPDGVLAGLMGMVDAGIIWWLDHHDEEQGQVIDRLARQVWLIIRDALLQLGLPIDDATLFGHVAVPEAED
jgi:AcrR family transcriptional regulator